MPEEDKPSVDIMTALKQSIETAKGRRAGMVKATGKTKKTAAKAGAKKKKTTTTAKAKAKKTTAKAKTKKRKSA